MRDKSRRERAAGSYIPRKAERFDIGPNTHPSKAARWIARGGGVMLPAAKLAKAKARHVHPRLKRSA